MIKTFLFLIMTLLYSISGFAVETSAIEKHILSVVSKQVKNECPTCTVQMTLMNKGLLEDIYSADEIYSDHWKGQTNLVLKLGDQNLIITADIRWMDQVAVANENIRQGMVIKDSDLRMVEKDVTYLKTPYIQNKVKAVGLTVKKIFQRGQIIDESTLKKPIVVRYGQPIQLLMQNGSIKLTMDAQAKGAGAVGDSIPVYVHQSKTKLQAVIIDHGSARLQ